MRFKTKFLQKCMIFNYEAVNMSNYYELYISLLLQNLLSGRILAPY